MSASVTAGTKSSVSSGPVLEISNLYAGYARRSILKDLSLTLERGEFAGLIGANGAGKTTLLRTILGLIRPASGQVRVLGESPRAARAHIGYVPQKHQFQWDFPLTVKDTVMTGRVREIGFFRRPAKKIGCRSFRRWNAPMSCTCRMLPLRSFPVVSVRGFFWRALWRRTPPCCCWMSRLRAWMRRLRPL